MSREQTFREDLPHSEIAGGQPIADVIKLFLNRMQNKLECFAKIKPTPRPIMVDFINMLCM